MSTVIDADVLSSGREWQALRERCDLTVPELAEITGLQKSTIHKLEAGANVNRSTRTLVLLALRNRDELRGAAL